MCGRRRASGGPQARPDPAQHEEWRAHVHTGSHHSQDTHDTCLRLERSSSDTATLFTSTLSKPNARVHREPPVVMDVQDTAE